MKKEKEYSVITESVEETQRLAEKVGTLMQPRDVLTLTGDLGAGKTSFTQGLARGLGIERVVNSPTFTIIKEYQGKLPLYHMDVYRMEDSFEDLGFDEYFYGEGVTVVEWPQMIQEQLPPDRCEITILRLDGDQREIAFLPIGARYEKLCEAIKNEYTGD
ncbi:tRNA (adenosine(37)-N6)-threonylcarbamoyltransferase complex ATPase subunit type 1 TsaE [Aneurinibacillus sp. Ricciae_BoGa-3]|uniref:tRNA (adenosine(37)-N6)-threonylcarbamoyltransferase complex ATPase subunit type 1 TsaE n=1 Tax=Aneurinibacillus sp. Ricciae_BoGa-3 TaxID=3022697 RepID=UPI00233FB3E9|nr:tRNA (adenosine(37)-N6)-threonylcarbamoyltransferase complex ATPase subunit type 1 TsaE [Aneurinibacillus sp. Ricciae_BoGa-3]WCK54998.1 tRNA (adenosine(37)-N6)-threonylcarbamoyltransferase complex ATPase subunit type 1 TsaE [Aneurinibacillus sp. Ricciae_BoGa-3]